MTQPKPGQAQFRNQYNEDCPFYCCKVVDPHKLTNDIFLWLQAFLNHESSDQFKAPQRAVLLAVYSFWTPKRPVCTASQYTIARRAGCQRSTVQKALALGVQKGWLTETKNAGRKANEYSPKVPSTFFSNRSTPIDKDVSDREQLSNEEMVTEAAKTRGRLEKARGAKNASHHVSPLPDGKHLSDLDIGDVFNVGDGGLTREEIVHHAKNDPKFSASFETGISEVPSEDQIFSLVHAWFNSNDEDDFKDEDEEEADSKGELSTSKRTVIRGRVGSSKVSSSSTRPSRGRLARDEN